MLSQAEIKLLIFIFPVTNGASFNFLKTFTAEVVSYVLMLYDCIFVIFHLRLCRWLGFAVCFELGCFQLYFDKFYDFIVYCGINLFIASTFTWRLGLLCGLSRTERIFLFGDGLWLTFRIAQFCRQSFLKDLFYVGILDRYGGAHLVDSAEYQG